MATLRTFPIRVPYTIFGDGSINDIGKVIKDLGAKKALIVTDKDLASSDLIEKVKKPLLDAGIEVAVHSGVEADNPLETMVATAKAAKINNCDAMIAVGGGSTMDNVKGAACIAGVDDIDNFDITPWMGYYKVDVQGLPKIMVPTTAGTGSEWTMPIMVSFNGHKKGMISDKLLATVVINDPQMTLNMPQKVTADTGMDALSHAVETYIGLRPNLFSDMMMEEAISLIGANLRRAYAKGTEDIEARYNMSFASMIACNQMTITGTNIGHGIAHALQNATHSFTHGSSCSIVMCAVMEFNKIARMERITRIAELMGEDVEGLSLSDAADKGIEAVRQLSIDVGMPQCLRDVGVAKEEISRIVDILFEDAAGLIANNPRQCSREDAVKILESMW